MLRKFIKIDLICYTFYLHLQTAGVKTSFEILLNCSAPILRL